MKNLDSVTPNLGKQEQQGDPKILAIEKRRQAIAQEKMELQRQRLALEQEIAELQAQQNSETTENKIRNVSRRSFLRGILSTGTAAAGAIYLMNKKDKNIRDSRAATKEKTPTTLNIEKKKTVESEIEFCKKIIESKEYERILENPYLVSALYYSKDAVSKMSPPNQFSPEKIIWAIYPLITPEFREGYINMLKRLTEGKNLDNTQKSEPLDTISTGKNLLENHTDAIDLFIKEGSLVYAMYGGVVVLAENGWNKNDDMTTSSNRGGNTVIVFNKENESFARYAHMVETRVKPGAVIPNGYVLGEVGHTGINASRPGNEEHLHLEINKYDREQGIMVPTDVFKIKKQLDALTY